MTHDPSADQLVVGIDLGGTNMQAAVLDDDGTVLGRVHARTDAGDGRDAVLDRLAEAFEGACAVASANPSSIAGVGIAAPGSINRTTGFILAAPNLGWTDVPLAEHLSARLGCPVFVDNDVNAAALGEYLDGAGRAFDSMLAVWVGTGVGGGLVLNGELFDGATSSGVEIGRTSLYPDEPRDMRILEQHASRLGMSRLAHTWAAEYPDSSMMDALKSNDVLPTAAVVDGRAAHDPLAIRIIEHSAASLGVAIANAVTLFAVESVVIGGGITESLGQPYVDLITATFREHVFPEEPTEGVRCAIVATELGGDAGIRGAGRIARQWLATLTH